MDQWSRKTILKGSWRHESHPISKPGTDLLVFSKPKPKHGGNTYIPPPKSTLGFAQQRQRSQRDNHQQ